ncbi:hypothetical protein NW762_011444 [Fusarium torreyae]|uniref:Copper-fist domain-containing protein n=1 Tax=Fusarium torreyae TaxID=1237075 RepID=A0A9W8RPK8_9HYPO|nr:hypothetical protein NW762_011444 [Fusarium torreyae]
MTRYNHLGQKIACAKCIRGHRPQTCKESHTEGVRVVNTVGRPRKNSRRAVQASASAPAPFVGAVSSVGALYGGFTRFVYPPPSDPSAGLVPSFGIVPSIGHQPYAGFCVSAIYNFDDLTDGFWDEPVGSKDVVRSNNYTSVDSSPGNRNNAGLDSSAPVPAPISYAAGILSPELPPSHRGQQTTRGGIPSQQSSIDAVYSTLSECIIKGLSKVDSSLP